MKTLALLWSILLCPNVYAAENSSKKMAYVRKTLPPTQLRASIKPTQDTQPTLMGLFEVRPSWKSKGGKIFGQNLAELGIRFSSRLHVAYQQQFTHNIYNNLGTDEAGMGLKLSGGFIRVRFSDIWVIPRYRFSFSYEPRWYVPTDAEQRANGMVAAMRNYFVFQRALSNHVNFVMMEVPIIHLYSRPGVEKSLGTFQSNPVFENRFYFGPEFSWSEGRLCLFLPFIFSNTRHSDFRDEASNNNSWKHMLWVYPELLWKVSPNLGVGVGYESGNLLSPELKGFNIGPGLEEGIPQFILQARF